MQQKLSRFHKAIFHPPRMEAPVLPRPRLLKRIIGPEAPKVTSLMAPSGYGKTTLLAQAYRSVAATSGQALWLSLGYLDDGAALPDLLNAAAQYAGLVTDDGNARSLNLLLSVLEEGDEPLYIFIDDLTNRIAPADYEFLRKLIEIARDGTQFLLASQSLLPMPSVRFEALGLMQKLTLADLAITETDLEELEPADLSQWALSLGTQVEGWPIIFQLASCRLQRAPGLTSSLVSGSEPEVSAFLEREVLRDVPSHEIARLLDASIVDRISGPLLDVLTELQNNTQFLNDLESRGIPVVASHNRRWFRLQPLLRAYLHDRLQRDDPGRIPLLHRRAAAWMLQAGNSKAALGHAMASGDLDYLRTIHDSLRQPVRPVQNPHVMRIMFSDETSELNAAYSDPNLHEIFCMMEIGRLDRARKRVDEKLYQDEEQAASAPDTMPRPDWALVYADLVLTVFEDRIPPPSRVETMRDRLMRFPNVPPPIPAAMSELVIASRYRYGDFKSIDTSDRNLWHARALAYSQVKIYALFNLGMAAFELGDLTLATSHIEIAEAHAIAAFGTQTSQARAARILLAEIAFARGDIETSQRLLSAARDVLKSEEVWFDLHASAGVTDAGLAAGTSWRDAQKSLASSISASAASDGLWRLGPLLRAQRLKLATLHGGDVELMQADLQALLGLGLLASDDPDGGEYGWRVGVPAQLAAIRFDLFEGRIDAAAARAAMLRPILEARSHCRRLIELDVVESRIMAARGDIAHAIVHARSALATSLRTGILESLIDEAGHFKALHAHLDEARDISPAERRLIDRLVDKQSPLSPDAATASKGGGAIRLTTREADLLNGLVLGQTFKEISFTLDISINTIKMHRARLYRKLGCNSRSRAIALGRDLISFQRQARSTLGSQDLR